MYNQMTSHTSTKSYILLNTIAIVFNKHDLQHALKLHVPNLRCTFHCLGHSKQSIQVKGPV
jgi:hypothetical protein